MSQFRLTDYRMEELDGQMPFEFAAPPVKAPWESMKMKELLSELKESLDNAAQDLLETLTNRGERVFEIKRHNDFVSVETDFGAPAHGLSFFKELIDPIRSHRYEPVHEIESVHKTHKDEAISIAKVMKARGYKIFNGLAADQYPSQMHFTNGGVTRAFSDVIENIVETYNKGKITKAHFDYKYKVVILLPVPTYGLFCWRLQEALRGTDIELMTVRRNDNGSVNHLSLKARIEECLSKGMRILAYYDSNPNNPTGYVRERAETEDIGRMLLDAANQTVERETNTLLLLQERELENFGEEKKRIVGRWANALYAPQGHIVLIDDMAYEGLEFKKSQKAWSFSQVSKMLADRTVVLKSISKIGLPGLRAGMMIGNYALIEHAAEKQLMTEFSASSLGVDVLTARFGTPSLRPKFNAHYDRLRRTHRHKTGVMEALVEGLENTNLLTTDQKSKLVRNYADYAGISIEDAQKRLKDGLHPFHKIGEVNAGFFFRINCNALNGRMEYFKWDDDPWPRLYSLSNSSSLYWIFRSFGMKVVSGAQQGLAENDMQVRVTTSIPEKEVFRFFDNMRKMRTYFFGEKPERQLDLFREQPHQLTM